MTAGGVQPDLPADGPDLSSGSLQGLLPGSLVLVRADWIDFYDTHYRRVVRFVMYDGATQAEAEDAAQEAFKESWNLLVEDPDSWLAVTGCVPGAAGKHARP
jgi:hypothetical protein